MASRSSRRSLKDCKGRHDHDPAHHRRHDGAVRAGHRNLRPQQAARQSENIHAGEHLLFVHGSTYPAHTGFDIPLGGQSWMDFIASHGYDVYCLDVRGYGRSTRPKAMDEPAQNNPPVARTPDAVKDITAVLNFILKRRNIARLNLLGWSWGCTLMAITAIQNPDKVARLCSTRRDGCAPRRRLMPKGGGPLGAYRTVTREQAKARWLNGVPRGQAGGAHPARLVRAMGRRHLGDRSGRREAESAGGARAERHRAGLAGVLDLRQDHVRPGQDHRADADRDRRVGRGHAALHGAGDLPADGEFARQAAGHAGRRPRIT